MFDFHTRSIPFRAYQARAFLTAISFSVLSTCGSTTRVFKDPGSEAEVQISSKSEALAEDLELICTEASEPGELNTQGVELGCTPPYNG